jgi:hypothetical protein
MVGVERLCGRSGLENDNFVFFRRCRRAWQTTPGCGREARVICE